MKLNFGILLCLGGIVGIAVACGFGCSSPSASSSATPALVATPPAALDAGWSAFTKKANPIFSGQYPLSGDASVIKDGSQYRMFYTCYDPLRSPQGPEICQALSPDGLTWSYAASGDANVKGRVLPTGAGVWDTAHETSFILKRGANYYLYYVGYIDKGGILASFPSSIGFAYSTDGTNFVVTASPIIAGTPRGYDADMITSPSIVDIGGGQLMMLYAGFCYNNCLHATGPTLLGATSTDGLSWTKIATPIIKPTEIPWSNEGVAESEIVKGPDGFYYLFMTVLQGAKPHQLAVARSANYTGPWQVNPQPILPAGAVGAFDEGEDLAPSVLIENGKTRMWFHGVNKSKNAIAIGYAEASWPLFK